MLRSSISRLAHRGRRLFHPIGSAPFLLWHVPTFAPTWGGEFSVLVCVAGLSGSAIGSGRNQRWWFTQSDVQMHDLRHDRLAQHAHAGRPPTAREIVVILALSYAARLRRRLMRNPLDRTPYHP